MAVLSTFIHNVENRSKKEVYISTSISIRFCSSYKEVKVSFFGQCSKMQIIPLKKFIIKTCFIQLKGQIISKIHLSLPNAYKLMCFDRNVNGNRDVKFLSAIIGHRTEGKNSLKDTQF